MDINSIMRKFAEHFGGQPIVCHAPGRVNLIGEHTDYNDGFVMPVAVELCTWAAVHLRPDTTIRVRSTEKDNEITADVKDLRPRGDWSDYVLGVFAELSEKRYVTSGADVLVHGEVPMGAGLSSSASLEVAVALALTKAMNIGLRRTELALLCQRAENRFVGVQCGIMDQFIACNARLGHAMLLDCRSLESSSLPVSSDVRIVICNTMVKHDLAAGEYNRRREECREAVRLISQGEAGVRSLRDLSLEQFQKLQSRLPQTIARRCRHVISENLRVHRAAEALRADDLRCFGLQMAASHNSLRDDYDVSCKELDVMVEIAAALPGVYGARMTGGGFGGCTVNLVAAAQVDHFKKCVRSAYSERMRKMPDIYISQAAEGAV